MIKTPTFLSPNGKFNFKNVDILFYCTMCFIYFKLFPCQFYEHSLNLTRFFSLWQVIGLSSTQHGLLWQSGYYFDFSFFLFFFKWLKVWKSVVIGWFSFKWQQFDQKKHWRALKKQTKCHWKKYLEKFLPTQILA